MNREQVQEIVLQILSESRQCPAELPLDFPVEASARHVHLTEEAVRRLFGEGAKLTPKRELSQPGQFLSEERVTVITPKGRIEKVAVLGPPRGAIQTELSAADCRVLGIEAPLRMSGDLEGAADVYLLGPVGMVEAKGSAIVAQSHIHMLPAQAEKIGIQDGQQVSVTIDGVRSVTLNRVICRVSRESALAMHIDFDEANACMLPKNAAARMTVRHADIRREAYRQEKPLIRKGGSGVSEGKMVPENGSVRQEQQVFRERLVTEEVAVRKIVGKTDSLTIRKGMIVTPSAKDVLCHAGVKLMYEEKGGW